MDMALGGGGPDEFSDSHRILIFTSGGDDSEIANWFRQEAEAAGWEVTDFETSEQYGSTRFRVSNDDWYGDFVVECKEAALEGYDGSMDRSESVFDEAAFSGALYPQN
ncbi:MAG: hypothetical protein NUK65_13275 [Firmicutes bacterium]|nr:hypothetical protein [Bacillota bacterium]